MSGWPQRSQGPLWGGGTDSQKPRHSWKLLSSQEARTGRRGLGIIMAAPDSFRVAAFEDHVPSLSDQGLSRL